MLEPITIVMLAIAFSCMAVPAFFCNSFGFRSSPRVGPLTTCQRPEGQR